MVLERPTKEGNSPVRENGFMLLVIIPAEAGDPAFVILEIR